MAVCLSFVFLGLLEFAYVNVLTRSDLKNPAPAAKKNGVQNGFAHTSSIGETDEMEDNGHITVRLPVEVVVCLVNNSCFTADTVGS